jgi:hypothetical protein
MPLLTVAELRTHVKTTLVDAALQRYLDANEDEIETRFGASPTTHTEWLYPSASTFVYLARPATAITTLTETRDGTDTVLTSANYRLSPGGQVLERINASPSYYDTFGERLVVVYSTSDETARRQRVLIKLCQFDIENRPGLGSQTTADQSVSYSSRVEDEREEIFDALRGLRQVIL